MALEETIEEKAKRIEIRRKEYQESRNYKYITGYHGTTKDNAISIINDGLKFEVSQKEKNWLGNGIYFYRYYSDAAIWHNPDTDEASEDIFHVVVKVKRDECFDLETDEDCKMFEEIVDSVYQQGMTSENQQVQFHCMIMNLIWAEHPQLKVACGRFAAYERLPNQLAMVEYRTQRREFCVRDNGVILQCTHIGNARM